MKNLDVLNLYYKFAPVLVSKNDPDNKIIIKIITTAMKKKIYTTPAFSVEEFEMNQVISTSFVDSNAGIHGGDSDANYDGPVRANNRGIWDED